MDGEMMPHKDSWSRTPAARSRPKAGRRQDRRSEKRSDDGQRPSVDRKLRVLRGDVPDPGPAETEESSERLRDRRLVQWFVAYLAVAWLGLQLTQTLAEIWSFPVMLQRGISLALALGAFPALVIAWYHGELGRQRVCTCEIALLTVLTAGAAFAIWLLCFA